MAWIFRLSLFCLGEKTFHTWSMISLFINESMPLDFNEFKTSSYPWRVLWKTQPQYDILKQEIHNFSTFQVTSHKKLPFVCVFLDKVRTPTTLYNQKSSWSRFQELILLSQLLGLIAGFVVLLLVFFSSNDFVFIDFFIIYYARNYFFRLDQSKCPIVHHPPI